jgi:hypothetical protein
VIRRNQPQRQKNQETCRASATGKGRERAERVAITYRQLEEELDNFGPSLLGGLVQGRLPVIVAQGRRRPPPKEQERHICMPRGACPHQRRGCALGRSCVDVATVVQENSADSGASENFARNRSALRSPSRQQVRACKEDGWMQRHWHRFSGKRARDRSSIRVCPPAQVLNAGSRAGPYRQTLFGLGFGRSTCRPRRAPLSLHSGERSIRHCRLR